MKSVALIVLGILIALLVVFVFLKDSATLKLIYTKPTPASQVSTPEPTASTKAITAGGVLSFNKYTIEIPDGWEVAKEEEPAGEVDLDRLNLTKAGYKISIFQAATGGVACLYTGDPEVEGPSVTYPFYKQLTTESGNKLRRGGEEGGAAFTVCEFQSNQWIAPTSFGHISITLPANAPEAAIEEIDSMLTSLTKI